MQKIKIVNKKKFIEGIIVTIFGTISITMITYFTFIGFCYFITTL